MICFRNEFSNIATFSTAYGFPKPYHFVKHCLIQQGIYFFCIRFSKYWLL
nr:MAG TPA: hypothetical protein [Caudoviricetes sp.]